MPKTIALRGGLLTFTLTNTWNTMKWDTDYVFEMEKITTILSIMNFTKKYAVYGDVHTSFLRLCRLYNVNPATAVDMSRESARNAIEDISNLIPLRPLSGDYPQLQEDPLSHPN